MEEQINEIVRKYKNICVDFSDDVPDYGEISYSDTHHNSDLFFGFIIFVNITEASVEATVNVVRYTEKVVMDLYYNSWEEFLQNLDSIIPKAMEEYKALKKDIMYAEKALKRINSKLKNMGYADSDDILKEILIDV